MREGSRRRVQERVRLAQVGGHGTGDRFGPIAEAWRLDGPLSELVALHRADTPEALQRVLVIPGRRTDTMPDQAVAAFRSGHGDDDTGLVESVVLAATNHRWSVIARPLLEALTAGGLLGERHIGRLALYWLQTDTVTISVPGAWLVDFYLQRRGDDLLRLDPAKTYTLSRRPSPQLRRWAAARLADLEGVAMVMRQAEGMASRDAAAVVMGLVDAAEALDEAALAQVLELAMDWPASAVRLAALRRLAASGRKAEALDRASVDRAATVRRWAARHRRAEARTAQPTLFG